MKENAGCSLTGADLRPITYQAGAYLKRLQLTGISMCSAVCFRLVLT